MPARARFRTALLIIFAATIAAIVSQNAFALITGGEGNGPINDPGWPKGAAAIFNTPARIAWWEGPPFGGGQWHAECRGDAKALNAVLLDFTKLDVKSKRVVLHDGVGRSFWLNSNHEPAKRDAAKMDWRFMVWQPSNWERLRKLPGELNPTDQENAEDGPPSRIDVYTGGNIRWADVKVPDGLKVVDERLQARGFTPADGVVLQGKVTDLATRKALAAKVLLQRVESQSTGGYRYPTAAEATADADGRWVLKKTPPGHYRVVIEADGFVPRLAGYLNADEQPSWRGYDCGLSRPASVTGRVTDDAGKPLADVEVHVRDVTTDAGSHYKSSVEYSVKTDKDGRFNASQLPIGKGTLWVHKAGYVRRGLGQSVTLPKSGVELSMMKSGRVVVTVDFSAAERPAAYIVEIQPESGNAVGTYGGSGHINDKNLTRLRLRPTRRVQ